MPIIQYKIVITNSDFGGGGGEQSINDFDRLRIMLALGKNG